MHDEMTEEQLQAAFEEQMRNIRVEDVVLQTVATLVNLAGRRLGLAGEGEKDVAQAQVAIDAARALMPFVPEEQLPPIKQAMSPAADGVRAGGHSPGPPVPRGEGRADLQGTSQEEPPPSRDLDAARLVSEAVGIFGGSGFYEFLDGRRGGRGRHALRPAVRAHPDRRDRGAPGGVHAAARRRPRAAPHRINYRANIWAMKQVGANADHRAVARAERSSPSSSRARS